MTARLRDGDELMVSKKKVAGRVALIGAGPGDSELLTMRAMEMLATADVLVGPAAVLDRVAVHAPAEAERLADAGPVEATAAARAGSAVTVVLDGDPLSTHAATLETLGYAKAFGRAKLTWELVPGISTAAAFGAYAGFAEAASGLSTHADVNGDTDWAALAAAPGTLILTHTANDTGKVASALVEHGRSGDEAAAVTVAGTTTTQRTITGTLDTMADLADAAGIAEEAVPALFVVGPALRQRAALSWWESRPLFGWRVLVPRTRAQAGETSALLRGYGAEPLEVPTIAVEPPRTPAPMERAIKGLVTGRYAWVVFTSVNAVKAVREKLAEFGLDARAFAGVKVAAVGAVTGDALVSFGIRPDLLPSGDQSSEGLLADFPEYDDILDMLDRVFLPRADIATETLVAGLKERGWAVDDITAYRTVRAAPPPAPVREAIKGGKVDAALFTSSSTVRNLVGIAGKPHERTVIACIGPQTAATARDLGLRVDVEATESTVPALTAQLAAFVAARQAEEPLIPASARPAPKRRTKR
ncbi:MAG TPA: uroporphyrinogen-III synthase [Mycobacteriales bacterium]|jgi:uroporphyrinogen III methyltransferase/synthase|nr:uroporphyrinogen-III synthase [Mycobacteriales bacterium]